MKIAILNECFLNQAHLQRLQNLGEVILYQNTRTEEEVMSRLKGVKIAVVDGFIAPLNRKVLETVDNLKLLVLPHTSYAMVDFDTANRSGVKVANAPGFSKEAVAELAIGLMFAVNRKIALMDREMRESPFESDPGIREHDKYWGYDLKGKTFGVIGLGRIGSAVAELAQGLGMSVVAFNRSHKSMKGVEMVSLAELLKRCDVISINLPLTKDTEHIISGRELNLMKPTAILVNVATAKNVDTQALYQALKESKIFGAGLDVIGGIRKSHPILELDNVVLTAHAGSSTKESFLENLPEIVVSDVEAFVRGEPQNIVN